MALLSHARRIDAQKSVPTFRSTQKVRSNLVTGNVAPYKRPQNTSDDGVDFGCEVFVNFCVIERGEIFRVWPNINNKQRKTFCL